jgi:hypothetical protein
VSKKQKLTRWFPGYLTPVRVGIYQRYYDEGPHYCHWNGSVWSVGHLHIRDTDQYGKTIASPIQGIRWRGLAEQPK